MKKVCGCNILLLVPLLHPLSLVPWEIFVWPHKKKNNPRHLTQMDGWHLLSFIQSPSKTAWGQMSLLWPKRSLTWLQRDEREGSDGKKNLESCLGVVLDGILLSSFFQCQIWKILVCGAQICDIVRWSDEGSDEMKLLYLQVRCVLEMKMKSYALLQNQLSILP